MFAVGSYMYENDPSFQALSSVSRKNSYSVLLTIEPPSIQPHVYAALDSLSPFFDISLSLAASAPNSTAGNVHPWSWGASLVPFEKWGAKPKPRLCSIMASLKTDTVGHRLRHSVVDMLQCMQFDCDALGAGYASLGEDKFRGHEDYMFSIVIENDKTGRYFSEKLVDALSQGTVPVYWGTPFAPQIFGRAVIPFGSLEELEAILPTLSPELYARLLPDVLRAAETAKQFVPPEQWLWENVFECAFKWHAAHSECDP